MYIAILLKETRFWHLKEIRSLYGLNQYLDERQYAKLNQEKTKLTILNPKHKIRIEEDIQTDCLRTGVGKDFGVNFDNL